MKLTVFMFIMIIFSATAMASELEIQDIDIEIDGNHKSGSVIKVGPESKVEFSITVENNLDEDDMENVYVTIEIQSIDDDGDIEEESDERDIREGDDKKFDITIDVPLRLETDESYDVTITAQGESSNGTDYEDIETYEILIDKERHELRFIETSLSSETVNCGETSILRLEIINTGEEDEDAVLHVTSSALDIDETREFELLEDYYEDENEYKFSTTISTEGAKTRGYPIDVRVEYDEGDEVLEKTINLQVEGCEVSLPEPEPEPAPVIMPNPTQPDVSLDTSDVVVSRTPEARPVITKTSSGWWDDNKWIVIILAFNLLVLMVGIAIVAVILSKRR
ncbi:hypothetical protein HQ545_01685 [Candidatus Woesearchaeota archaeon]|nr:hypothetical protein [Candidatus Woesearchaeota archaeon]